MKLLGQLGTLESAGLIHLVQFEPDLEYFFRHNLLQDAAYATLLADDRRRLHRVVGEAIEHLYPDRLNEYAARLARHFERAGDDQHALQYFVRAGDTALDLYANQEAESQYRSALALTCSEVQRAELLAGLGEALLRQSRFEEAIQVWREAIELHQDLGNADCVARLYARSARAAWHGGDQPEALRLCQEGLDAVAGMPESPDLAALVHEAGRAYHFTGERDEAKLLCEQALEMAERLGAVDVQADTLATLGVLPHQTAEESLSALSRAVELAEDAGLLEIAVRAHHNLGSTLKGMFGDLPTAHRHFFRAVELARQRGAAQEELLSLISGVGLSLNMGQLRTAEEMLPRLNRLVNTVPDAGWSECGLREVQASLLEHRGIWDQALQLRRLCCQEMREQGNLQGLLDSALGLGRLLLEMESLGEHRTSQVSEAALEEAVSVLREAAEIGDRGLGGGVWTRCQLSVVCVSQGRIGDALRWLDEARQVTGTSFQAWNGIALSMAEARVAVAEERWPEALTAFESAAEQSQQMGLRWQRARILLDWAETLAARGESADLEGAEELLREAREVFEDTDSLYYAVLVDDRLQALRTRTYVQTQALESAAQELVVAWRIQEGLLPRESPYVPGWQMAATLAPARRTSGDFYDFISLPGGRWGIVVADVADKGAGAALYMALSRTLLRTYATEFVDQPEKVLAAVNQRALAETDTDMFVTVFYGVLDPDTGALTYCNAGHNPPIVFSGRTAGEGGRGTTTLTKTGMALGVVPDTEWGRGVVHLTSGDALVAYTDGLTDALNPSGIMFGQSRLMAVIQAALGSVGRQEPSAQGVQDALLSEIHRFVGEAPQVDDITLLVVVRA